MEPQIELKFWAGGRFVHIYPSSDEDANWVYDIYQYEWEEEEGSDAIDGGLCTGTLSDAIQMAIDQLIGSLL